MISFENIRADLMLVLICLNKDHR